MILQFSSVVIIVVCSVRSSPTDYFLPSEIKAPDYLRTTTADNVLEQSGYGENVLSDNSRSMLKKYQGDIDALSSRMNETLHGRAVFLNETAFDNVTCCYPELPRTVLTEALQVEMANLTAKAILVRD